MYSKVGTIFFFPFGSLNLHMVLLASLGEGKLLALENTYLGYPFNFQGDVTILANVMLHNSMPHLNWDSILTSNLYKGIVLNQTNSHMLAENM